MATSIDENYSRSNWTTFKYCLVVGLGAILFGIDTGCMVGFFANGRFLQDFGHYDEKIGGYNMRAGTQTLLMGLLLTGILVAVALGGPIGARYGRRVGLALCAVVSIVGPVIQVVAPNVGVVALGRAFSGAGIGFAANFCIMYWAEVTPARQRGMVVMMYQGFANLGTFVGACTVYGTRNITTRWSWRGPLLTMLIAPLILAASIAFLPDTPRWFVHRGRIDDAQKAMWKLRGPTWPEEDIANEIQEVVVMDRIERELEGSGDYPQCFKGTDGRRTRITILVLMVQQWTGISFITAYGTYFFFISNIKNPFTITVITSVCGLAGSASAFPLVRTFGRRPLLITGGLGCGLSMWVFAIVGVAQPDSVAAARTLVAFTCCFIFSYGATWGPIPQAVEGELPSNRLRSQTVSIGNMISSLCTILIVCGSPYLLSVDYVNLSTKMGFIFGSITTIGTILIYLYLPETKDRTLEEIDEMFLNHVPARKFKSYVCTGEAGGLSIDRVVAEKGFQVQALELSKSV